MAHALHELTELLRELPGIGPRQARRLSLWLARRDPTWLARLRDLLTEVRGSVKVCPVCMRLHESKSTGPCTLCASTGRDTTLLMVVEKDLDLENIEKTGTYTGVYFVLGGTASPIDKEPQKRIRMRELQRRLADTERPVRELIFALSATTEGEDTEALLRETLEPYAKERNIVLSVLGRGLSTGTELEYVDADTMKSALEGRHTT